MRQHSGGFWRRRARVVALTAATALTVAVVPALTACATPAPSRQTSATPGGAAQSHTSAAQSPISAAQSPASVAASAYDVAARATSAYYVAKVNRGTTQSLVVASRATGAVVRAVASGTVVGGNNVFEDVDLAPDGTVWAVQATRGAYASKLVKYAPGKRGVVVMPYVVAARVSPDGRRLAVTGVSPDADHDGKGTTSVRVGPVGGSKFTTLGSWTFMVDPKTGDPTQQYAAPVVAGWVDNASLAVEWGCCDEGSVAIIPATRPTSPTRWKALTGDGSTEIIGVLPAGRALVLRDKVVGDGIKVPLRTVGKQALSLSSTGRTRLLWSGKPKDDSTRAWLRLTDQAVAATRAVPLQVTRVRFPFKGAGFVTAAYI